MEEYALLTEELEETGITGRVYRLRRASKLLFEDSVLLTVLRGDVAYGYDGREGTLGPGGLLFVQAGNGLSLAGSDGWLLCCFLPSACLGGFPGRIRCCSADREDQSPYQPLRRLLGEALSVQARGGPHCGLLLQSVWKRCLYLLLTAFGEGGEEKPVPARPGGRRDHEAAFQDILAVLNSTYMENVRLNELAEQFFYTPSYLSRLFRQNAGMGFLEYLTQLRLQKAVELLRQPGLEIQQIAEKTGFPNARAFSEAFQKKYGLNPSLYRRRLFRQAESQAPAESLGKTVRRLRDLGLLDALLSGTGPAEPEAPAVRRETVWRTVGPVSAAGPGTATDVPRKNSILNISRLRDLLLDNVQEQIRVLQREIGYTYLCCHGFLADDMQIYRQDLVVENREARYGFLLYEKALGFVRAQGLRMIIYLGNTPSILAESASPEDLLDGSRLALPRSMGEWRSYIRALFSFLSQTFGPWLAECPVMVCPDLEIVLSLGRGDPETWFRFYLETVDAVRSAVPEARFLSPRISCSRSGFRFARRYLRFCGETGQIPDCLNVCFVEQAQAARSSWIVPMELRHFTDELRSQARLSGLPPDVPIQLLEYYYSFTLNHVCDSAAGAMFPLRVTLEYPAALERLGYWFVSDCTTEDAYGYRQFLGNRGLFTQEGIRKASYYALYFLSRLGETCLLRERGCVVTRSAGEVRMLLYWDVPEADWTETVTPANVEAFYSQFPEKHFSVRLTEMSTGNVLVAEQSVSRACGSAFEEWAESGGALLDKLRRSLIFPTVMPRYRTRLRPCSGELTYEAALLPFEMRFVTIRPEGME